MPAIATDLWTAAFDAAAKRFGWTAESRRGALAAFPGLPTADDEEWRFTSVEPIAQVAWRHVAEARPDAQVAHEAEKFGYGLTRGTRLAFVNGLYAKEHSRIAALPQGVVVMPLSEAVATRRDLVEAALGRVVKPGTTPFAALNAALWLDGALVWVPDGVAVPEPIHLMHLAHGADLAFHPRYVVALGKNAEAQILESWSSPSCDRYLANVVTEIDLAQDARLTTTRVQDESGHAIHVACTQARLATGSLYHNGAANLGAALFRHDLGCLMDGPRADAQLFGLTVVSGHQHADSHTVIDHAKPHCPSREYYKAILNGASRSVFNGKVLVRLDAQKTDARQTNKNLVLSDDARVDTKPQLEIFADDVKCTHGATVGQLDDEMVYYCQSRGISPELARGILTYAFARDVLQHFGLPAVRQALDDGLVRRLLDAGTAP
jgi:Fe-S cluster assembly protein SufD